MNVIFKWKMKITKEQVEHVAHLARLSLTDEEIKSMTKDMEMILEFADQINQVEIKDVNATAYVIPINKIALLQMKVCFDCRRGQLISCIYQAFCT